MAMGEFGDVVGKVQSALGKLGMSQEPVGAGLSADEPPSGMDDASLIDIFKKFKKECFEDRWVWERQWQRNIFYVLNRQWIYYASNVNEWRDVRLAKNIPRPTSSKPRETVQSIRATLTAIKLGANVRPSGSDPTNIQVAAVADEMLPVLHEEHTMDALLEEHDYWFVTTGNAFIHSFWERDGSNGYLTETFETCGACGEEMSSNEIAKAEQMCPRCGQPGPFQPAVDEMGEPRETQHAIGKGATIVLSPFELAFPNNYARFTEVPGVIRMRWRTKDYYMQREELKAQLKGVSWQNQPTENSMRLFKSLPAQNDLGSSAISLGTSGRASNEEGLVEYEMWLKPTPQYPKGLVARFVDDANPIVLHEEEEALPGPIPYTDVNGDPVFTFAHSGFDHVGGRIYASSPLDPGIQRINQMNQLDSLMQMMVQRMGNPLWLIPKGSEIERLTGDPGVLVRWNPLTVGGNAKPERIPGADIPQSLVQLREYYAKEYEEATGTFDVVKGAKPTGVEAFSALQLLVERSQSRFANAFQSRGMLYREWCKFALELERDFGPDTRTKAVMSPARSWTYETFKRADLQGAFSIVIEDGSTAPKTNLGQRANIEHLNQLGLINKDDPDTRYAILQTFAMTKLAPSMDIHVQMALQKQQAFEEWAEDPQAQLASQQAYEKKAQEQMALLSSQPAPTPDPLTGIAPPPMLPPPVMAVTTTPLALKPWFNVLIHRQEFLKWANGDRAKSLLATPGVDALMEAHLQEIDAAAIKKAQQMAMRQAATMPPPPGGSGGGPGGAMANSNRESGGHNEPRGNGEGAQQQGPA